MKLIYLSGPMTGYPDLNKPVFERFTKTVQAMGFATVNPHDVPPTDKYGLEKIGEPSYDDYLLSDIVALVKCDGILMLPDWKSSRGARVELEIATTLGHAVFESLDELMRAEWDETNARQYRTMSVNGMYGTQGDYISGAVK